jgi:sRNA-binding regulator protein Hfq
MPITDMNNNLCAPCMHHFVFIAKPEQMAFIVVLECPVRRHAYHAVKKIRIFTDQHAAKNQAIRIPGTFFKKLHGRTVHGFGASGGVGGKTRTEHLGEYDQVSGFTDLIYQSRKVTEVLHRIFPKDIRLQQYDVKIFRVHGIQFLGKIKNSNRFPFDYFNFVLIINTDMA